MASTLSTSNTAASAPAAITTWSGRGQPLSNVTLGCGSSLQIHTLASLQKTRGLALGNSSTTAAPCSQLVCRRRRRPCQRLHD